MTATFREAVAQASWWTRYALDRAPNEPDAHPGVIAHLKAAAAQHAAVEQLTAEPREQAA